MKNIILDTDFGIDCDDAVALAMLINLQKKKECKISAVTLSTTREGAASAVRSVFSYYGADCPDIGKFNGTPLQADAKNVYALALKEKYKESDDSFDSVKLLRNVLYNSEEKITISSIGPLCNISALLLSDADDICTLSGVELVKEKVDTIYIMGGNFDGSMGGEFNIDQDLTGARNVCKLSPVPLVFISGESCINILTGKPCLSEKDNPVALSIELLFKTEFPDVKREDMERCSWDPFTTIMAVRGTEKYCTLSDYGTVSFPENGKGYLDKDNGLHRIVLNLKADVIKNDIDELCAKGSKL